MEEDMSSEENEQENSKMYVVENILQPKKQTERCIYWSNGKVMQTTHGNQRNQWG